MGSSGFIGTAVVEHLTKNGVDVHRVKAPRIELDPSLSSGAHVAQTARNIPTAHSLRREFANVDVVINAAGLAAPDAPASPTLFGANALLPAVVAVAASQAGVSRLLHLSSAAVQGDRPVLDASMHLSPFSPYSRAKALGELGLLQVASAPSFASDLCIVRATSVQGHGRPTTRRLQWLAGSPLASVASPGTQPSVVSSVAGLAQFLYELGTTTDEVPHIVVQPWEGLSVLDVLEVAGGRKPFILPRALCRAVVTGGKLAGLIVPRLAGAARRIEVLWFGQKQLDARQGCPPFGNIRDILAREDHHVE